MRSTIVDASGLRRSRMQRAVPVARGGNQQGNQTGLTVTGGVGGVTMQGYCKAKMFTRSKDHLAFAGRVSKRRLQVTPSNVVIINFGRMGTLLHAQYLRRSEGTPWPVGGSKLVGRYTFLLFQGIRVPDVRNLSSCWFGRCAASCWSPVRDTWSI